MEKDNKPESGNDHKGELKGLGLFGVVVGDLMGYTGAGVGLGYLAMWKLNAPWWILMATSLLGLSLAFYRIYKLSQKML